MKKKKRKEWKERKGKRRKIGKREERNSKENDRNKIKTKREEMGEKNKETRKKQNFPCLVPLHHHHRHHNHHHPRPHHCIITNNKITMRETEAGHPLVSGALDLIWHAIGQPLHLPVLQLAGWSRSDRWSRNAIGRQCGTWIFIFYTHSLREGRQCR